MVHDQHADIMAIGKRLELAKIGVVVGIAIVSGVAARHLKRVHDEQLCAGVVEQQPFQLADEALGECGRLRHQAEIVHALVGEGPKAMLQAVLGVLQTKIDRTRPHRGLPKERLAHRHALAKLQAEDGLSKLRR